ncbi:hypothetical protein AVEN_119030-1 [Araneus ventricosus]|uniref:Uncharacterized protein n=1 Tax=Araneus ventricosus TaxID=182803 RepID=A0A4Y2FIF1_ARAVE|nr:hypothetical protein AVEN_119030-1 [Araneus ventricosus]
MGATFHPRNEAIVNDMGTLISACGEQSSKLSHQRIIFIKIFPFLKILLVLIPISTTRKDFKFRFKQRRIMSTENKQEDSHPCCIHSSHLYFRTDKECKDEKNEKESQFKAENYSLEEIEQGFKEYLDRPPEERAILRDPFVFRDRDLHVNHCLRVIPDSFKEKVTIGNFFGYKGRGGLVVRSRLWGRRAPGSRPDSTEDPPCMGPVAR